MSKPLLVRAEVPQKQGAPLRWSYVVLAETPADAVAAVSRCLPGKCVVEATGEEAPEKVVENLKLTPGQPRLLLDQPDQLSPISWEEHGFEEKGDLSKASRKAH